MSYITLDEVTALAQTVIKDADDKDRNIWKTWAWNAVLNLGIGDDEIKVAELYPKNYTAALPPDCRYLIDVSVFDTAGNQLGHVYRGGNKRIYADRRVQPSATTNGDVNSLIPVDISNDRYNIHLGTNGQNVGTIIIRYFAYPLDENGLPLIREEDAMACVHFIRYMDALRRDDNRSKIQQDEIAWFREADRARARKKMASLSPDKARSIMKSLNSLIPNFRFTQNF